MRVNVDVHLLHPLHGWTKKWVSQEYIIFSKSVPETHLLKGVQTENQVNGKQMAREDQVT